MDITYILDIVVKWLIPVVCADIMGFKLRQYKFNKAMKASMLSILRSQITGKCEKYLEQGFLPEHARYCLEEMLKNYKVMGGNHGTEMLVEQCFALPLKKNGGVVYENNKGDYYKNNIISNCFN